MSVSLNPKVLTFLLRGLRIFLGLISLLFISVHYKNSVDREAWLLALSLVTFVEMSVWGAVTDLFKIRVLKLFSDYSKEEVLSFLRRLIKFFFLINGFICAILIVAVYLGGFDSFMGSLNGASITISYYFFFAIPVLLFNQLTNILTSIVVGLGKGIVGEGIMVLSALLALTSLYFSSNILGVFAIVLSLYIQLLSSFLLLLITTKQFKKRIYDAPSTLRIKKVLGFDLALWLVYVLAFFNPFYEKLLLSGYDSAISAGDYSRRIYDAFFSLFIVYLSNFLVPGYIFSVKGENRLETDSLSNGYFERTFLVLVTLISFCVLVILNISWVFKDSIQLLLSFDQFFFNLFASYSIYFLLTLIITLPYTYMVNLLIVENRLNQIAKIGIWTQVLIFVINYSLFNVVGPLVVCISYALSHLVILVYLIWKTNVSYGFRNSLLYHCLFLLIYFVLFLIIVNWEGVLSKLLSIFFLVLFFGYRLRVLIKMK